MISALIALLVVFALSYLLWAATEPYSPQARVREALLRACTRLLCLVVLSASWFIFPLIMLLGWNSWKEAWAQDWKGNLKDSYAGLFAVLKRGHL